MEGHKTGPDSRGLAGVVAGVESGGQVGDGPTATDQAWTVNQIPSGVDGKWNTVHPRRYISRSIGLERPRSAVGVQALLAVWRRAMSAA